MTKRSDIMTRELPRWLSSLRIVGTVATVVLLEMKRPLRRTRQNKVDSDLRTLIAAGTVKGTLSRRECC